MTNPFYQDERVTIWHADALDLPIPDKSVDLIVTSPPYFGIRSYRDGGEHYEGQIGSEATPTEFVGALLAATQEMIRVLKPSGSLWVNLGDKYNSAQGIQGVSGQRSTRTQAKTYERGSSLRAFPQKSLIGVPWRYALRCIDDLGLILRAEVIWSKPNGLPESVTDRVRRSHETWFHFTKQPRYYSDVDAVREAHAPWTLKAYAYEQRNGGYSRKKNPDRVDQGDASDYAVANPLGKIPGSVWEVATQPLVVPAHLGVDHFAAFPMEWPRRIISGWSPIGGVVLDPFGGTGTTALVAAVLGRIGWHIDLSADYCRLAQWRVTDPGERARAALVEKPPLVPDGQGCLDLSGVTA